MSEFGKKYNHEFEGEIYKNWQEQGFFSPEKFEEIKGLTDAEKFVISIPPPNVTGVLHVGHALCFSLEDIMVRHARMNGKAALWVPGTDHAGIATQVVVEKKLAKESGITRHTLGREKFLEKVWEWVKFSRSTIVSQIKAVGSSVDWSREQFTLSEKLSRAVRKSFVNLYNSDKIYQSSYIINWCPRCQTVLSDLEVEYQEQKSNLYYIRYFIEGKGDSITVATVRPETMFGDVAVAVHPKDRRYKKFIGKNVLIPIINRPIPVIADEHVEVGFGTGALKITPAHDPADYEIGKKHNLPLDYFAIDKDGKLTDLAGEFAGKDVEEVFDNIVQYLGEIGNLEKKEEYVNNVPKCERCGTRLQPLVSKQWFVDVDEYAKKSIDLVKSGEVKIYGERFNKVYFEWLENIRPWCISRQLWRGHRIPVWYCSNGHSSVLEESFIHEQNEENKKIILSMIVFNLVADSRLKNPFNLEELVNILFEDSLTPQEGKIFNLYLNIYRIKFKDNKNALEQIDELEKILASMGQNPSAIIEQGGKIIDILDESNFIAKKGDLYQFVFKCKECGSEIMHQDEDVLDTWFSSALWPFSVLGRPENTPDYQKYYPNTVLETGYDIIFFWVVRMMLMGVANTGQKPFDNIYLNGLVRDEKGSKMSKSKGNVVNPMDMVKKYGADSLRLSLVVGSTPGNDVKYSETKTEYSRRFVNKLWNASRFIFMKSLEGNNYISLDYNMIKADISSNIDKLNDFDTWMLSRINDLIEQSDNYMSKFMVGEFCQSCMNVAWHDFCDWYIEISKYEKSEYTDKVLLYSLASLLKLLHPYIPFVTEKLWQSLGFEGFITISDWPKTMSISENKYKIGLLMDVIKEFRTLKNNFDIKSHEKVEVIIQSNSSLKEFFESYKSLLQVLLNAEDIKFLLEKDNVPAGYSFGIVMDVKVGIKAIREISWKDRLLDLQVQLQKEEEFLQNIRSLISSPGFIDKAPENVVKEKQSKMEEVKTKILKIQQEINRIKMENK